MADEARQAPEPQGSKSIPAPEPTPKTAAAPDPEIEGLRAAAKELASLKAAAAKAAEDDAKKKGEFEKLHSEAKARAEKAEADLAARTTALEALEKLLEGEVRSQVDAIADEALRTRVRGLVKGRPVLDQREILATVLAAAGGATSPAQRPADVGAPGRPKPPANDPQRFAKDRNYRVQLLSEAAARHR